MPLQKTVVSEKQNTLFPVFLKLEELRLLIIGGGNVALEKLNAVLANSPSTEVTLVAKRILPEIIMLSEEFTNIVLFEREVAETDFEETDLVFIAVNDPGTAEVFAVEAHRRNLLVNVADTPGSCDFYLGSIVRKGDLKIAISTNGKSPTLSKRLREVLQESIPEETQLSIAQLHELRKFLNGDFAQKVKSLNAATSVLIEKHDAKKKLLRRIRYGFFYGLSSLALMIAGYFLFTYFPFQQIGSATVKFAGHLDKDFSLWMLGGFLAQLVDGSLGMAYGVTATSFLMAFGISPAVASASMHASEIFTTGTSSLVYLRYKNFNGKLFRILLLPGAAGAVAGACMISLLKPYLFVVKPVIAVYLIILGVLIIRKALGPKQKPKRKVRRIGSLAAAGGFLDSIGGGGWGPIVTTTLVAGGRDLRYTVGSAHAAKFFVALISAITFFFMLGTQHWTIIAGLVVGGIAAAPFSVWMSTRISTRNGLILVGLVVIITSIHLLLQVF